MKTLLCLLAALPLLAQEVVPLRPGAVAPAGAPPESVEERGTPALPDRSISHVSVPTLTVYLPPKDAATGIGIVICPGGGYTHLAIDKEGHEIARWLNTLGVAGFVLKYRLPGAAGTSFGPANYTQADEAARVAIEDGLTAMRLVRTNAAKWNVKPERIGIMGFSAGGHLASMVGMLPGADTKPNFLVLGYAAIPKEIDVTKDTPPTFLVQADDDRGVKPANNSVRFYQALKQAQVPAEMLIYSSGGHGFGIRKTGKTSAEWTGAFAAWLKEWSQK